MKVGTFYLTGFDVNRIFPGYSLVVLKFMQRGSGEKNRDNCGHEQKENDGANCNEEF
jgi:hypothetical protein